MDDDPRTTDSDAIPDHSRVDQADEAWSGQQTGDLGSTTGATASRHSAGPSGLGQSSGRGPDAVRDPERLSDEAPFATSDPAMTDQPAEGGETEVDE